MSTFKLNDVESFLPAVLRCGRSDGHDRGDATTTQHLPKRIKTPQTVNNCVREQ